MVSKGNELDLELARFYGILVYKQSMKQEKKNKQFPVFNDRIIISMFFKNIFIFLELIEN